MNHDYKIIRYVSIFTSNRLQWWRIREVLSLFTITNSGTKVGVGTLLIRELLELRSNKVILLKFKVGIILHLESYLASCPG